MAAVLVFAIAVAIPLYVLFGYPLLVALLARSRPRPIRKGECRKTVTVILPVHNGEAWIERKLETLRGLDYPQDLMDIIVIADGCSDGTAALVRAAAGMRVRLIELPRSGKAAALNAGIAEATGEILFFTDVRQKLDPASLRGLVSCFADAEVGAASGELIIIEGATSEEASTGLYWKYEKFIRRRLSAIDSLMGATGCIYAMRRELATRVPPETLLDDVYLPMAAFFRGYRLVLDESAKAYDYPTSLQSEFRRKVRTQAGIYQLLRQYPGLLGPGNRMWIHFVSYKLGRLMVPFALLAAAVSAFFLPDWWSMAAVAAQGGFYGLALADMVIADGIPLKKLTSPTRTFVALMAAAFCAASVFIVPSQRLWTRTQVSSVSAPK